MIEAECRTDDNVCAVTFDATPWFEDASAECIQNLVGEAWTGRRGAAVALTLMDRDVGLLELFRYVLSRSALWDTQVSFTCRVNRHQALAWLRSECFEWFEGLGLAEYC